MENPEHILPPRGSRMTRALRCSLLVLLAGLFGCDGGIYGTGGSDPGTSPDPGPGDGPGPVTPVDAYETLSMPQRLFLDPPYAMLDVGAVDPQFKGLYASPTPAELAPCANGACADTERADAPRQSLTRQLDLLMRTVLDAEELVLALDASILHIRERCSNTDAGEDCIIGPGQVELLFDARMAKTMADRAWFLLIDIGHISQTESSRIDRAQLDFYNAAVGRRVAPPITYKRHTDGPWQEEIRVNIAPLSQPDAEALDLHLRWVDGEPELRLSLRNLAASFVLELKVDEDPDDYHRTGTAQLWQGNSTSHNSLSLALADPEHILREGQQLQGHSRVRHNGREQRYNWIGQGDADGGYLRSRDQLTASSSTTTRWVEDEFDNKAQTLLGRWCIGDLDTSECTKPWIQLDSVLPPTADFVSRYRPEDGVFPGLERLQTRRYRVSGLPDGLTHFAIAESASRISPSQWLCQGTVLSDDEQELYCWGDLDQNPPLVIIDTSVPQGPYAITDATLMMIEP